MRGGVRAALVCRRGSGCAKSRAELPRQLRAKKRRKASCSRRRPRASSVRVRGRKFIAQSCPGCAPRPPPENPKPFALPAGERGAGERVAPNIGGARRLYLREYQPRPAQTAIRAMMKMRIPAIRLPRLMAILETLFYGIHSGKGPRSCHAVLETKLLLRAPQTLRLDRFTRTINVGRSPPWGDLAKKP